MANIDEYYRILGLEPGASPEKVKQAYRDLLWVWHPDRFEGKPRLQKVAQEKLKDINSAYEQLKSAGTSSYEGDREEQRNNQTKPSEEQKKNSGQSASKPPPQQDVTAKPKSVWRRASLGLLLLVILSPLYRQLFRPTSHPTKPPQETTDTPSPMSGGEPGVKAPTSADAGLARLREEVIGKMKESRAAAEKLLAQHEDEKKKLAVEYQRRQQFYSQGLIRRSELDQVERALAEAIVRVEEDKRWLKESVIAITEANMRDELLRTK